MQVHERIKTYITDHALKQGAVATKAGLSPQVMVNVIETAFNVSFYKPANTVEALCD